MTKTAFTAALLFFSFLLALSPNIVVAQQETYLSSPCGNTASTPTGRSAVFQSGIVVGSDGVVRQFDPCRTSNPTPIDTVQFAGDGGMVQPLQTWHNLYVGIATAQFLPWNINGWADSYLNANTIVQFSICANVTQHIIGGVNHGSTGATCKVTATANDKATAGPKGGGSGCAAYNWSGTANYVDTDTWHTFTDTTGTYTNFAGGTDVYQQYSCFGS